MTASISAGQRFTVIFFALCSVLGIVNVVRGLLSATKAGLILGLAQGVFTLFAGTARVAFMDGKKPGGIWEF